MKLPTLSQKDKDNLDSPITEAEVRIAIKCMKTGKSPGVDGFPAENYQKYIDILCQILTDVFQEALQYGMLPEGFNEAIISLIQTQLIIDP